MAETIGYRGQLLNLVIRQGADFGPVSGEMQNPDGSPADLTGCTIRGQIRKNALDATVVKTFVVSITDIVGGLYEWGLPNAETVDMVCGNLMESPESKYAWDLELEDSTGRVTPLYYGTVFVFREVTRA